MRFLRRTLGLLLCAMCAIAIARAQENAEITGTVTDPSGAAVPNAIVTITHVSTGTARTTQTNVTGMFDFPALHIGTYDLKATAGGFETYRATGLILSTAQTLRADVRLQVGVESQLVTVVANALQIQTDTNQVSSLITGEQVLQLATNGRNMMSLTALGTGVTNRLQAFSGQSTRCP
jgi:hypothetical protein